MTKSSIIVVPVLVVLFFVLSCCFTVLFLCHLAVEGWKRHVFLAGPGIRPTDQNDGSTPAVLYAHPGARV